MNAKARILAIKLAEKKIDNQNYFEELGVKITCLKTDVQNHKKERN